MKRIITLILLIVIKSEFYSQSYSDLKIIFVPHPRSEDQLHQSVYPALEQIKFPEFDVRMLGGDLTYSTSKDDATLSYCNNLFDLQNPATLWSFGNHDVQSGHRELIKKYTSREGFHNYSTSGITFIVLDTEINANSFKNTFIKGSQLQMVKEVCDTIKESRYLILLHHRLMWMINNDYFKPMLNDSIAASSRSMDTTNFYSDIYPLLQQVKNRGIKVLCFGGDKSKINIEYSPEEGITFYAARLASDLPDNKNNVILLNFDRQQNEMKVDFVPLDQMNVTSINESKNIPEKFCLNQNYPNPFNPNTTISFEVYRHSFISLKVFDVFGGEVSKLVEGVVSNGTHSIVWNARGLSSGVYFYRLECNKYSQTRKLILLR